MLESRNHSKSGVKPEEFVVERSSWIDALNLHWLESSVDPRYMDFGEVDSSALHPTTQKELWNKRWVLIYLGLLAC